MHAFSQNSNYRLVAIIIALLLLWMLSGLIFNANEADNEQTMVQKTPSVAVKTITAELHSRKVTLMARTAADEAAELVAQVAGRIEEKPVERGDVVQAGDLIVRIETAERAAAVAAAEARVKSAEILVKAARRLSTEGFKAASTLAEREAELGAAQEALAQARLNLARTKLSAPFNGVVDSLHVDVGDTVSVGQAIGTLVGTEKYLVVGYAAQKERDNIGLGQVVSATLANGVEISGAIRFVAQEADPQTLTYRVDMEVAGEKRLPVGMASALVIPYGETQAHFIPHAAIILGDKGELQVRTVEDGKAASYTVELLEDTENGLWVSGLPPQAQLIVRGQLAVTAGQAVSATEVKE